MTGSLSQSEAALTLGLHPKRIAALTRDEFLDRDTQDPNRVTADSVEMYRVHRQCTPKGRYRFGSVNKVAIVESLISAGVVNAAAVDLGKLRLLQRRVERNLTRRSGDIHPPNPT